MVHDFCHARLPWYISLKYLIAFRRIDNNTQARISYQELEHHWTYIQAGQNSAQGHHRRKSCHQTAQVTMITLISHSYKCSQRSTKQSCRRSDNPTTCSSPAGLCPFHSERCLRSRYKQLFSTNRNWKENAPVACWVLSPVMAPTMESLAPARRSRVPSP